MWNFTIISHKSTLRNGTVGKFHTSCFFCRFKEVVTWDEIDAEIDFLYSEIEKLQMPTCLSHNDLWHTNILYI